MVFPIILDFDLHGPPPSNTPVVDEMDVDRCRRLQPHVWDLCDRVSFQDVSMD